ncbi:hypothetical protein Btru_026305 [Bulinus truncatus]|nr:hypothetical protein Btru_026305 [Bulinus truncatus]
MDSKSCSIMKPKRDEKDGCDINLKVPGPVNEHGDSCPENHCLTNGTDDPLVCERKLNPTHDYLSRDCALPVRPLSPCPSASDTEISPGEVLAPCSLLPEEHYIMSPTITDNQFNFLETDMTTEETDIYDGAIPNTCGAGMTTEETDTSDGAIPNTCVAGMTTEETDTSDGAIPNTCGAGMTNSCCDNHPTKVAAGEDKSGPSQSKFSQLVGQSNSVNYSDDDPTPFNNNRCGTNYETLPANNANDLKKVETPNLGVQRSNNVELSTYKTDLKNILSLCSSSSVVSEIEPQQEIKQRIKSFGYASPRNKTFNLYNGLPNRPTNAGTNSPKGTNSPNIPNTSTKRLFRDNITDRYKIKRFSLPNQHSNVANIGTLNESVLDEQDDVPDAMTRIIRELRLISEGQSPACQTNVHDFSPPRENLFTVYDTKRANNKTTGSVERKHSDSLRDLSPIHEQVDPENDTLQSNNLVNGQTDSIQYSSDDLSSQKFCQRVMSGVIPIKTQDTLPDNENYRNTFDADNMKDTIKYFSLTNTDINQYKRTFQSETTHNFESPSRKRVSFYLDDETSNIKCSESGNKLTSDSTPIVSTVTNTDENKVTTIETLINSNECKETQLKRFYSLSEEKENEDNNVENSEDRQVKRINSLPAQARKGQGNWRHACDQSKLCKIVVCDTNTHAILEDIQLLNLPVDDQSNLGYVKSIPDVESEIEKQHNVAIDNDGYDNIETMNASNSPAQDKLTALSYQGKRNMSLSQIDNGVSGQTGHLHLNQLRWFSLDGSVSESTPLATRFLRPAPTSAGGAVSNHRFSFEPEDLVLGDDDDNDLCPNETVLENYLTSGERNDDNQASISANHHETNCDTTEEDTLSLEFFLPVKKQYIRLHRSTFIGFILKYSIFLLTFIFWVASITGIAFGVWMLMSNKVFIDDVTDLFLDPYVLLSFVAGIIFLISFFGCVGALRENILLLNLFYITLTVVLVMEGLMSTLVFLFYTMPEFRQAVKVGPEEVLKKAVKDYFDNDGIRHWIDTVQKEFQCCGVSMSNSGYLDWQENIYFNCSKHNPSVYRCSVPLSCCIFEPGEYINYRCGADIMNKEESYILHMINTKGCMKSFGEWLGKNDVVIGYVALGVIIPQILGVVSARFFVRQLRRRSTTRRKLSDTVQISS